MMKQLQQMLQLKQLRSHRRQLAEGIVKQKIFAHEKAIESLMHQEDELAEIRLQGQQTKAKINSIASNGCRLEELQKYSTFGNRLLMEELECAARVRSEQQALALANAQLVEAQQHLKQCMAKETAVEKQAEVLKSTRQKQRLRRAEKVNEELAGQLQPVLSLSGVSRR